MSTEYGSGIYLTQNLDFEINTTGDLRASFGIDELEKDLAYNSIDELKEIPGRRKTQQTISIVKSRVEQLALADPRVSNVIGEIDVFYPDARDETIEVSVTVDTVEGEQELVFPVGERE